MKVTLDSNIIIGSIRADKYDSIFEISYELFFSKPLISELISEARKFKGKANDGKIKVLNWDRDIRREQTRLGEDTRISSRASILSFWQRHS